ncbi:hypothetical protein ABPG74_017254 [Tetrahymena malaccensis]
MDPKILFNRVEYKKILTFKIVSQITQILNDFSKYEEIQLIDQSPFSLIFSAYNIRKFRREAIKIVNFEPRKLEILQVVRKEAIPIKNIQKHPNIIQIYDEQFVEKEGNTFLVIEMELYEKNLDEIMEEMRVKGQQFEFNQMIHLVITLLDGLTAIHQAGSVHRNIKASNIVLKDGVYKYTDYSLPNLCYPLLKSRYGTPMFIGPEVMKNEGYKQQTDIYCLGFLLMKMDNISLMKYNIYEGEQEDKNKQIMRIHYDAFTKNKLPEDFAINKDSFFYPFIMSMIQSSFTLRKNTKFYLEKLLIYLKDQFKPIPVIYSYKPDFDFIFQKQFKDLDETEISIKEKEIVEDKKHIFKFINFKNEDADIINIAKHFYQKKNFYTHFCLECNNREISDKALQTLSESFKQQNKLIDIQLNFNFNNKFTDVSLNSLTEQLKPHVILQRLHLNFNYNYQFSNQAVVNLFDSVGNYINLKDFLLNLRGNSEFTPQAFNLLCSKFQDMQNLQKLSLIFSCQKKLKDDSMSYLASYLKFLFNLTYFNLELQCTWMVTDDGYIQLLDSVESLQKLEYLRLLFDCNKNFTNETLKKLDKTLQQLRHLKELHLSYQQNDKFQALYKEDIMEKIEAKNYNAYSVQFKSKYEFRIEDYQREVEKSEIFESYQKFIV